ncbi:MAG TPA: hypothetical protein VF144_06405 [Chitinophagaceae bacterium]
MKNQHDLKPGAQLSKVRTFLFWCLAVVWFSEMLFLGVPFLNRVWIDLWQVVPPQNSQLAAASMIIGAVGAPVKGAFLIMALWGIRSANASTRIALFFSMSLVPPFNVAMPFRYQGFVLGPTVVGSVLSVILWVSFFLLKEPYRQLKAKEVNSQSSFSGGGIFQYMLFIITSIVITILAFLFLFFPKAALELSFPCMPNILNLSQTDLSGMIYHSMASGTHLLALAIGSWIATANCRSNPSLRHAMTIATTAFMALFFIFPIRHMLATFGFKCIPSLVPYVFALLLMGWLIYAFSDRVKFKTASLHPN